MAARISDNPVDECTTAKEKRRRQIAEAVRRWRRGGNVKDPVARLDRILAAAAVDRRSDLRRRLRRRELLPLYLVNLSGPTVVWSALSGRKRQMFSVDPKVFSEFTPQFTMAIKCRWTSSPVFGFIPLPGWQIEARWSSIPDHGGIRLRIVMLRMMAPSSWVRPLWVRSSCEICHQMDFAVTAPPQHWPKFASDSLGTSWLRTGEQGKESCYGVYFTNPLPVNGWSIEGPPGDQRIANTPYETITELEEER